VPETYRGLLLGTIGLRPDAKLGIKPLEARKVMAHVKEAIDILHRKLPFSIRATETLQSAGDVVIVYDPHFPEYCEADKLAYAVCHRRRADTARNGRPTNSLLSWFTNW
jgi:hypothetical protein